MKVSSRGEYGVRAMVALAKNYGHGPMSIAAVSKASSVPMPYLEQLIGPLRRAGLVQSTRGAHGGYQLTRDPHEVRMGEVIQALEGPIAPMICASEDPDHASLCSRSGFCNVNLLWVRVRAAVVT